MRALSHHEAGQLIAECPESVRLLLHTRKPRPVPSGNTVHSGWLEKRGGSGITPRNWRRRWFVLRDDCIAYYYSDPEVGIFCSVCEIIIIIIIIMLYDRTHVLWVLLSSGTTQFPKQFMM